MAHLSSLSYKSKESLHEDTLDDEEVADMQFLMQQGLDPQSFEVEDELLRGAAFDDEDYMMDDRPPPQPAQPQGAVDEDEFFEAPMDVDVEADLMAGMWPDD